MKNCKKCGNGFEPQKGLLNYCSIQCRNSRTWSDKDKIKKSVSAKKSEKVKIANSSTKRLETDINFYKKIGEKRKEIHKDKILNSNYDDLSFESLRYRILYEQKGCCNNCGLNKWMDKDIPLELEHKDGNNKNNIRENLEMLCPNCHALTETWRGRNKNSKRLKITDEKLFNSLMVNDWNIRQSLLDVGLSAKGGNYKRCYKLKREYFNTLKHTEA